MPTHTVAWGSQRGELGSWRLLLEVFVGVGGYFWSWRWYWGKRWGDHVWTHWLCGLSVTQRGGCPLLEEFVLVALGEKGLAGIAHWPLCCV